MSEGSTGSFMERYMIPISVLLGAVIIAFAVAFGGGAGERAPSNEHESKSARDVAESLGLDVSRIDSLLETNEERYQAAITADREEGSSFGVSGTPGTIVGTQLIPGAYPLDVVEAALRGEPIPQTDGAPPTANVNIADVKLEGNPFIGSVDAPTTIAVWFDFQCSFCKRFDAEVLSELEKNQVAGGQLRIVFKDFQFLGQASVESALYSRAVWEAQPDRWHEWYKAMMQQ